MPIVSMPGRNAQEPEPLLYDDPTGDLYVHSIFHTIQGEGPLTGHPAIFVRLAGCNLQCPQCDTVYTGRGVRQYSASALYAAVECVHPGPRLVVITGGEPFRQNITPFVDLLVDAGYQVQIETNGTLPVPFALSSEAWIVCSPKTGRVHPSVERAAVAYKYVLNHDSVSAEDGLPLRVLDHTAPRGGVARPPERLPVGAVYLQPADCSGGVLAQGTSDDGMRNALNLQACVRSCMRHGYTLQLQLHKILGME